jgi:HSP20 family protein
VDIVEDAHELRILADMPGTSAESVDIDFEEGALKIHGRVPQRRGESVKYLLEEFGIGDFYRVFQIGEVIDATRISADYAGGVLTVHLPKVEAAKPRKINVQAR